MFKIISMLIILGWGPSLWAVKGSDLLDVESVKDSSCLLESRYDDLEDGKTGVCSGVIYGGKIITAKHCLYHKPSSLGLAKDDPIKRVLKESEILNPDKIKITCQGKELRAQAFKIHPQRDIAIISVDSYFEGELSMIKPNDLDPIIKNRASSQCAAFGFGLNNSNIMRDFGGVQINELSVYRADEAFLEIEIDGDFKQLALTHANSMFSDLFMTYDYFPKLISHARDSKTPIKKLESSFDEFIKKLEKEGLSASSLFDKNEGPLFKDLFFEHFKPIYQEAYGAQLKSMLKQTKELKQPMYRFITNVNSSSLEKSGIDYGDSGGAFACKVGSQWYLAGINSKILTDSSLSYRPKPWEPMNSRPLSRMTKNGEVVPLLKDLQSFLKE